jgi:hypothetical protein
VINEDIAQKISDCVFDKFLEHYAGLVYMGDVDLPAFKQLNP